MGGPKPGLGVVRVGGWGRWGGSVVDEREDGGALGVNLLTFVILVHCAYWLVLNILSFK